MGMGGGTIAGRKKALEDLREYARVRHITIHDGEGQPVSMDQFLEQAVTTHLDRNQKALLLVCVLIGLLLLLSLALVVWMKVSVGV